jgi:hypothetical protein
MRGVLVEYVHAGAEQLAGIEMRQRLAQLGFGLAHHLLQSRVHVHDVVIGVGHYHVRLDHVEAGAHPQIDHFLGDRLLEHLGRLGDIADFVAARDIKHVNNPVIGQLDQHAGRLAERLADRHHTEYRRDDEEDNNENADADADPLCGCHRLSRELGGLMRGLFGESDSRINYFFRLDGSRQRALAHNLLGLFDELPNLVGCFSISPAI